MQVIRVSCIPEVGCLLVRRDKERIIIRQLKDDDSNIGVADTIRPPIKNEYPRRSPYRHPIIQKNDRGSSSSLDTIRPHITHENPQLFPYSSSTTLLSNGSIYNASFMTSPSDDSFFEVRNYIAEVCLPGYDRLL